MHVCTVPHSSLILFYFCLLLHLPQFNKKNISYFLFEVHSKKLSYFSNEVCFNFCVLKIKMLYVMEVRASLNHLVILFTIKIRYGV